MKKIWQEIVAFVKDLFKAYGQDDAFNLGAALAYYTIFSIAPLLVVVISLASYFAGPEAVRGQIYGQLSSLIGPDTAEAIQGIVKNAYVSGKGWIATAIGIGTLLIGATGLFAALQNALNKIWEVAPRPNNTILAFAKNRLLSFSYVVGLGFLLLVSLVINALVVGFANKLTNWFPVLGVVVISTISLAISFGITVVIFAALFKFLPDAHTRWRDIWPGAIFTALLFALGKYALSFYFSASNPGTTYGAAGALITLLLWTYYSSQILFLGAEFVYVWAQRYGVPVRPAHYAVRVIREEIKVDANGNTLEKREGKAEELEKNDHRSGEDRAHHS